MYTEDDYEQYLNEMYGDVTICGYGCPAGFALREVAPESFDIEYDAWYSKMNKEQSLEE